MINSSQCEMIRFESIDFSDPIFDSVRRDYPDHERWISVGLKTTSVRSAFIVRSSGTAYAGVAILKVGEGPEGPSPRGMKISTFKVAPESEARGIADILLSCIFRRAIELQVEVIFSTLLPSHEDLARYFELHGFRRAARELDRGERIYVADIAHPERIYSSLNRLAYDVLATEYLSRSETPGPSQESPEYLAGLLSARMKARNPRVLELGPGSGSILRAFSRMGYQTVGVEISPKMAAVASANAPAALISIGDALAIDFVKHSFDGVYAGAFLHLFPQADAASLVRKIARWTKGTGAVFVNTSVADQHTEAIELKTDYIHKVARYRSRWTEAQFRDLLESNGLAILDRATTDEMEREKFWVAYICAPRG